jgi:hypothetical protein
MGLTPVFVNQQWDKDGKSSSTTVGGGEEIGGFVTLTTGADGRPTGGGIGGFVGNDYANASLTVGWQDDGFEADLSFQLEIPLGQGQFFTVEASWDVAKVARAAVDDLGHAAGELERQVAHTVLSPDQARLLP